MEVLKKTARLYLTILLTISSTSILFSQTAPSQEYQIKAIFLFNFTQFIEWPAASFSSAHAPLVIGVLGENPFGPFLQATVSGEKVNGHPLQVQYYESLEKIKACHILFINLPETKMQKQVLESLRGRSILTVSDGNDFLENGGMVRFHLKNNKVQLQINPDLTRNEDLKVSSKLLRVSEIFVPFKNN